MLRRVCFYCVMCPGLNLQAYENSFPRTPCEGAREKVGEKLNKMRYIK